MAALGSSSRLVPRQIFVENPRRGSHGGSRVDAPWRRSFRSSMQVNLGRSPEVASKLAGEPPRLPLTEGVLGLDAVAEAELREKGFKGLRKTKLVCTVGPACCSSELLERLAAAGMNVARLNMCHNSREWHRQVMRTVKALNREKGFCVSLMMDTEGSQTHVVDHGGDSSIKAEEGSMWLFTSQKFEGSRPFTVKASFEGFSEGVQVGDVLVVEAGMASFEVVEKLGNDLRCRCTDPGLLLPRAKLSFWRAGKIVGSNLGLPTLSTKDWADIDFGIEEGVNFIAVSFVRDANDIHQLKSYLSKRSAESIRVLAKIECLESLENLREIVEASDGVMVARGDLGVQIPLEHIPSIQKDVTSICRELNKPVIVASQLLESMIEYPTPTRAEVADAAEAVRQSADGLMLSGESAVGAHPEKALSVLRSTSRRMEMQRREDTRRSHLLQPQLAVSLPDCIAEQICNCAVEMAHKLGAAAICVYTKHGQMASLLSRNRPDPPVLAFTDDAGTRKALNLHWGVVPIEAALSNDMERNVRETTHLMAKIGLVRTGDVVLVVSDLATAPGSNPSTFQSIQVKTIAAS